MADGFGLQLGPAPAQPEVGEWLYVRLNATPLGTVVTFNIDVPAGAQYGQHVDATAIEVVPLTAPDAPSALDLWGLLAFIDGGHDGPTPTGPLRVTTLTVDDADPNTVLGVSDASVARQTSALLDINPGSATLTGVARSPEPINVGLLFRFVPSDYEAKHAGQDISDVAGLVGLVELITSHQGFVLGLYDQGADEGGSPRTFRTPDVAVSRHERDADTGKAITYRIKGALPTSHGWGTIQFDGSASMDSIVRWETNGTFHGTLLPPGGEYHPLLAQALEQYGDEPSITQHASGPGPSDISVEYTMEGRSNSASVRWYHIDVGAMPDQLRSGQ